MTEEDIKKDVQNLKNIEIKINAKSGKASGNLFKRNPVISNNPSLKTGQNLSGKLDFSKNKKDTFKVKSGQTTTGQISKPKK
jgi:hypothetical protein|tara:strand:- start:195 stop:440 length:246 start_codon:yes stop_codon:yes gene_type:complete